MRTKSTPKADMKKVWCAYKRTGERELRNTLMEQYLPLVKYNAERIGAKLPDEVEDDDLVSAGIFGLMDAIESFDLDRGVKFETYCAPRIRGAILDELRSLDWVPRLVRSRSHQVDKVWRELEFILGRAPTEREMADRMKMSMADFVKLFKEATAVTQTSLSRKYGEADSYREVSEVDVLPDKRGTSPLLEVQRRDLRELMTRGLTRAERLILVLYYYEEMTMKEIGVTIDLSESRVSQMHSAIINRLKQQLAAKSRELVQV